MHSTPPLSRESLTSLLIATLELSSSTVTKAQNMANTRILLTGPDGLTGSHILAQLLSEETVSVRAVTNSFEATHAICRQYQSTPSSRLDLFALYSGEDISSGTIESALTDDMRPFEAVVHTLIPKHSDNADCLAKFIHLETESVIAFLAAVQRAAPDVRRVVVVTSLVPFARWLVGPQTPGSPQLGINSASPSSTVDTEDLLVTSQASNSTVHDAIMKWRRASRAHFDVVYISTPSVYGPTVHPLETSSDLSDTNRRIWDICSSEPQTRTELPPHNISHYADVRVSQTSEDSSNSD